ncbi:hypothetical protein [Adhaeretor mobilis]|uniref:Copper resistance protein D domain-containing protein n=1 Tax=Adhaeretor mobilis TaxID=1930276 RepID=A0A517MU32_9BACT|nr:hypothetical protein [Adhaeretor mobilis]QDS98386.1 hypothetical protein HG15A2_16600 [Adhaeretor mobilis]
MLDMTWLDAVPALLAQTAPELIDPNGAAPAGEALQPTVDAKYMLGITSRVLHILSAIVLGGGLFYLKTVFSKKSDGAFADRRGVWAKWVGIASLLLIVTGLYNFWAINSTVKADGAELPKPYHMLFGIKALLGVFVMFVGSILAGKTEAADKFRAAMPKWLNLGWAAVLAIVVLAAVMRSLSVPLL